MTHQLLCKELVIKGKHQRTQCYTLSLLLLFRHNQHLIAKKYTHMSKVRIQHKYFADCTQSGLHCTVSCFVYFLVVIVMILVSNHNTIVSLMIVAHKMKKYIQYDRRRSVGKNNFPTFYCCDEHISKSMELLLKRMLAWSECCHG